MKEKKRWFSSVKKYSRFKRRHLFIRAMLAMARRGFKKTEVIFSEPLPSDEAVIICSNHALDYGPTAFLTGYKRPNRMWSDASLCYASRVHNHAMLCFWPTARGMFKILGHIAGYILSPILPIIFRGLEVIPVYRNPKMLITFEKTAETIAENKDVIIFPETEIKNPDYKFVNHINNGFIRVAKTCYLKTGKIVKFYPAYACKPLRKLIIGHPITVDPSIPDKLQLKEFKRKIADEIERIANELPPHEIVPFNLPADPQLFKKYGPKDKYDYKDLRNALNSSEKRQDPKNDGGDSPNA